MTTKVSTKKKTEKVVSKAKAGPKKEALLKEAKVKTETKPAKSAGKTVTTKKKTEAVTEPTKATRPRKKKIILADYLR